MKALKKLDSLKSFEKFADIIFKKEVFNKLLKKAWSPNLLFLKFFKVLEKASTNLIWQWAFMKKIKKSFVDKYVFIKLLRIIEKSWTIS